MEADLCPEGITDTSVSRAPTGFSLPSSAQKLQSHTITIATHETWPNFPASELLCLLLIMASLLMKLPALLPLQIRHLPPSKHCSNLPYSPGVCECWLSYQTDLKKSTPHPGHTHTAPQCSIYKRLKISRLIHWLVEWVKWVDTRVGERVSG